MSPRRSPRWWADQLIALAVTAAFAAAMIALAGKTPFGVAS